MGFIRHILIVFMFFLATGLYGQYSTDSKKAIKHYETGKQALLSRAYTDAINSLTKAMKEDPAFVEAYLLLGELYYEKGDLANFKYFFGQGLRINPERFPRGFMHLGNIHLQTGDYQEALDNYLQYKAIKGADSLIEEKIEKAKFALELANNPVPFEPERLPSSINSNYEEYWPSLSIDEQKLVFTRLMPKNPNQPYGLSNAQEDFYISEFIDSTWQDSTPLGSPINHQEYNEGAQSLTADGNAMYYTACNRPDGMGLCDIYYAELKDGQWQKPVNLGPPINSSRSEKQPSISPDGQQLYFSSNREGGMGGMDIWVSTKKSTGQWSAPKNLGDSINTEGDETSPFIHPDGRSLYFASDKHPGLGGSDLFVSYLDSLKQWKEPVNLGYPINTYHNEISLIVSTKGTKAYYSSSRDSDNKDIYNFTLPEHVQPTPVSYMKGIVFDIYTRHFLEASFLLIDLASGDTVNQAKSEKETGSFLVSIPTDKDYALHVQKSGYLFFSENFSLKGEHKAIDPYLMNVPLKPIKEGEKVVLKNVFFDHDSYRLKDESKTELQQIAHFLQSNPGVSVELGGHTDDSGSEVYNQQLSEKRAQSAYQFLIEAGIPSNRLSFKGYGESQPEVPNTTEENKAQNRRTELKIISTQ